MEPDDGGGKGFGGEEALRHRGGGGGGSRAAGEEKHGGGGKRQYEKAVAGGPENEGAPNKCVNYEEHGICAHKARTGVACRFAHKGGVWADGGRQVVKGFKRRGGAEGDGGDGRGRGGSEKDE